MLVSARFPSTVRDVYVEGILFCRSVTEKKARKDKRKF
jgi:hypothetical protein